MAFLVPFIVRSIPEILMGVWPAGFDVITYYAPYMHDVKKYGFMKPFSDIVCSQTAPLTYLFIGLVAYIIPLNAIILSKFISPVIYGFLGLSIYIFVKEHFNWTPKRAFLTTITVTLYFVTLRFSWDMWKNTLGLAFFILAICNAKNGKYKRFLPYSILCILSHELMAAMLGSVLLFITLYNLVRRSSNRTELAVFALVGLSALLGTGYYAKWVRVFPQPQPNIPIELLPYGGGMRIPHNYLEGLDWYGYKSANYIRFDASILMLKMYGPILPLAILGWKNDVWINSYITISLIPFLSLIFIPAMALPAWHRSAFLLTIPLTLYAANSLAEMNSLRLSYLAFLIMFAVCYTVLPPESAFVYYGLFPSTYKYLPTSMLQNSVSITDLNSVAESFEWLNSHLKDGDCLLAPEAYRGWAKLLINKANVTIVPYNFSEATPSAALKYYGNIYLIWWDRDLKWYGWSPPAEFRCLNLDGRIAVYAYAETHA